MAEKGNDKKGKGKTEERSFWKTIPGLLTGIAAIITAISGLLVALSTTGLLKIAPTSTDSVATQTPTSLPTDTLAPTAQPSPATTATFTPLSSTTDCLDEFLDDVPADRVSTVEVGTQVMKLIAPPETMEEIIALRFEDLKTPIGAMKFYAFPENLIMRIVDIVDANCQRVEEYAPSESPDKNTLGYYEVLNLSLNGVDYSLRLNMSTDDIYLDFFYRDNR